MTIRTRFLLCFLIPTLFGLGYILDWISNDLRRRYLESMEESLVDTATLLSSIVAEHSTKEVTVPPTFENALRQMKARQFSAPIYGFTKTHVDIRVYITDASGIVLYDSDFPETIGRNYSEWRDVKLTLQGKYGARSTRDEFNEYLERGPTTSTLYIASPIEKNDTILGSLTVCKPTVNLYELLEDAKWKIIKTGLIAGLLLFLIGAALTAWITRPIELLAKYTQAIREGRTTPMPQLGNSEIGKLGKAVAEMQATLEEKSYVENYVQNLTHEIKGPLSAIQGAAELMQEDMPVEQRHRFLNNIEKETHRITNIIDRLLLLASLENRDTLKETASIPLSALVHEIIDGLAPVLTHNKITVDADISENITATGDAFLLEQAFLNLLHNAIRFSPPSGLITVKLSQKENTVTFLIKDTGPGIPEYALPRVFEKFYSNTPEHSKTKGTGLGLNLVKEVAQLHGGSVQLKNSPEGGAISVFTF